MRALLLIVVMFVASCGPKAKPAEPERKQTMTVTDTTIEVVDYTHFAPDSAEIAPDQTDVLGAIASTLEANPGITRVEVQGRADASEHDPAAISQARAEAVVAYLVAKGIAADRLVAKGYAADPLASDDAAAHTTANRVVAYIILERSDQ